MYDKVLVTGASGFIAAHIIKQLFEQGYSVVGTVRSEAKGEFFVKQYPEFKYEIVKDVSVLGSFDHVFQAHPDIKYVLHTSSPFHFNGTDPENDLIVPAINGTLSALNAAHTYGPAVKKVVVTSSFAAMVNANFGESTSPSLVYTEKSWNLISRKDGGSSGPVTGYLASKALAERAAWDFLENNKPAFTLTTIQIPFVWGPNINDIGIDALNTSNGLLLNVLNLAKDATNIPESPAFYVDVRDAATTHLTAMTSSGLDNKRCFSIAGPVTTQRVLDALHLVRPEESANLPLGVPGSFDPKNYSTLDNSETQKYLKLDYIPFEKTIADTVERILELKKIADSA